MIVGACSVTGLFVSIGGMYLVWTTFEATLHANTIAHETARHELRAYLGTNSAWTRAGEEIWLFKLQNKGQTPASEVLIETTLQIAGEPIQRDRYVYGQVDPGFTWVGTVASPKELAVFGVNGEARAIRLAKLDIVVRYRDIYNRSWVRTSRFEISPQHKKFRDTSSELWDFHLRDSYETEATE